MAAALGAGHIQTRFLFFDRYSNLKDFPASNTAIIVVWHGILLLTTIGLLGEGGEIHSQQLADFLVDLAQEGNRLLLCG